MKNYITFLKKEILESIRTYKLFIMLAVFFMLGIMNPLMAKFTPDILSLAMPEGMNITIAEPSAVDSWTQFYKNVTQMGLIIIVIVFSGIISTELSRGTLINILTKGLSRRTVILSKYTYMLLMWTVNLLISFLVTWGYTVYLFPEGKTINLIFSVFCLWLFGVFLLAILLFGAVLFKSSYGSLLLVISAFTTCTLLNMVSAVHRYNPLSLMTDNMDFITNVAEPSKLYPALGITVVLSLVLIISSVMVFRKKHL